jgi:tetratricopeptide (TPR) repeat protein
MDLDLAQQAVSYAISGNWEKALQINKLILKENPKDVDSLSRLARAYAELGDFNKARRHAKKVLSIDPFNKIASKSLDKWKDLKQGETIKSGPSFAQAFLEEPGKTKLISLMHICNPDVLAKLDSGDEVKINTHGHRITITTVDGIYVGKLPDDLSAHLRNLIKYGNEYLAIVKSIDKNDIKIFIREIKKSKKLKDIPSFSADKIEYISFTPPELVHTKANIPTADEDED